jgi:hypothetical protein
VSLRLHWGCDIEGCDKSTSAPYEGDGFDAGFGHWSDDGTSGWIDGVWHLATGWQARNTSTVTDFKAITVLCPQHAQKREITVATTHPTKE